MFTLGPTSLHRPDFLELTVVNNGGTELVAPSHIVSLRRLTGCTCLKLSGSPEPLYVLESVEDILRATGSDVCRFALTGDGETRFTISSDYEYPRDDAP